MGTGARLEAEVRAYTARGEPRGLARIRRFAAQQLKQKTATPDQGGRYNSIGTLLPRNQLAQRALVNGVRFLPVGQQWRAYKECIR